MGIRFFSDRKRPVHLGPYPLERLRRRAVAPDLAAVPPMPALSFHRPERPESIVNAMGEFQAMMDAIRDGTVNPARAEIPDDPVERANHLKAFGYFSDASMVGVGPVDPAARLETSRANPEIDRLAHALRTRQTKTLASGIDVIMADLKESMEAPPRPLGAHPHAIVFLYEHHRDPDPGEPGSDWIMGAQDHRACLRATETATVIANYIRLLGYEARAHTPTCSDLDLNRLAVSAGLVTVENGALEAPWLGRRFGLAAVSTDMDLAHDAPLAPLSEQGAALTGPGWRLGMGHAKPALNRDPYARRRYVDGAHPFERLKRAETPPPISTSPASPACPSAPTCSPAPSSATWGRRCRRGPRAGITSARRRPALRKEGRWGPLSCFRTAIRKGRSAHRRRPQCREPQGGELFSGAGRGGPVALPGLDVVFP